MKSFMCMILLLLAKTDGVPGQSTTAMTPSNISLMETVSSSGNNTGSSTAEPQTPPSSDLPTSTPQVEGSNDTTRGITTALVEPSSSVLTNEDATSILDATPQMPKSYASMDGTITVNPSTSSSSQEDLMISSSGSLGKDTVGLTPFDSSFTDPVAPASSVMESDSMQSMASLGLSIINTALVEPSSSVLTNEDATSILDATPQMPESSTSIDGSTPLVDIFWSASSSEPNEISTGGSNDEDKTTVGAILTDQIMPSTATLEQRSTTDPSVASSMSFENNASSAANTSTMTNLTTPTSGPISNSTEKPKIKCYLCAGSQTGPCGEVPTGGTFSAYCIGDFVCDVKVHREKSYSVSRGCARRSSCSKDEFEEGYYCKTTPDKAECRTCCESDLCNKMATTEAVKLLESSGSTIFLSTTLLFLSLVLTC